MSCAWCIHWLEDDTEPKSVYAKGGGQCTLNPVWVPTHAKHFCGHIQTRSLEYHRTTHIHAFFEQRDQAQEEADRERKERIRLQKENKALRAKVRVVKRGTAT